jgi:inosine-uridine nucleoside N-ribohydrolase
MKVVVIDTDPGIDDALALLLAWGSPEIHVEALTTVAGNVPVETGTTNVLRLVEARRPVLMPTIAVGAAAPLARPLVNATKYHGGDGLGDLPDWPAPALQPGSLGAVDVITAAARRRGAALTLVALGPLTNIALALEVDRPAVMQIGRFVVMGGAVDVPGNITPTAEFNIHVDPDAAARVFAAGLPLDLVPLDATRQALLPRDRLHATLARTPGPLADRIAAFTVHAFRVETDRGAPGMILHDPLAMAVAIGDDRGGGESGAPPRQPGAQLDAVLEPLVEWAPARIAIGRGGETRRSPGPPNCRIATVVHAERFLDFLLPRLCPAPVTHAR